MVYSWTLSHTIAYTPNTTLKTLYKDMYCCTSGLPDSLMAMCWGLAALEEEDRGEGVVLVEEDMGESPAST